METNSSGVERDDTGTYKRATRISFVVRTVNRVPDQSAGRADKQISTSSWAGKSAIRSELTDHRRRFPNAKGSLIR
jgi:hypothetical protein